MNMRGLSIRRENGPGLAQLARHHWQREADLDLAKRWFRQALMCSPADVDVLVQYGLFLIEALGGAWDGFIVRKTLMPDAGSWHDDLPLAILTALLKALAAQAAARKETA